MNHRLELCAHKSCVIVIRETVWSGGTRLPTVSSKSTVRIRPRVSQHSLMDLFRNDQMAKSSALETTFFLLRNNVCHDLSEVCR